MQSRKRIRTLNLQMFAESKDENKEPEKDNPEKDNPEKTDNPAEDKKPDNQPEASKSEAISSSNKSDSDVEKKVAHLIDLVQLTTEKAEATYKMAKEAKEDMQAAAAELRETTGLLQGLVGDMDAQTQNLITASAALVKLHKEQNSKKA